MFYGKLNKKGDSVLIKDEESLSKEYKVIDRLYAEHAGYQSVPLRESMALMSFIYKNYHYNLRMLELSFPFSIMKSESPDFLLRDSSSQISIEVVKIIPRNLAALHRLVYRTNGCDQYESDASLFDDTVLKTKDELKKYLLYPNQPLTGNAMYGDAKERFWGILAHKKISEKCEKFYDANILLLDDHHIFSSYKKNIIKQLRYFGKQLKSAPILPKYLNIISDNPYGVLVLFQNEKWCSRLYEINKK